MESLLKSLPSIFKQHDNENFMAAKRMPTLLEQKSK